MLSSVPSKPSRGGPLLHYNIETPDCSCFILYRRTTLRRQAAPENKRNHGAWSLPRRAGTHVRPVSTTETRRRRTNVDRTSFGGEIALLTAPYAVPRLYGQPRWAMCMSSQNYHDGNPGPLWSILHPARYTCSRYAKHRTQQLASCRSHVHKTCSPPTRTSLTLLGSPMAVLHATRVGYIDRYQLT